METNANSLIDYIRKAIEKTDNDIRRMVCAEYNVERENFYRLYVQPMHKCFIACKNYCRSKGYNDERFESLWRKASKNGVYIDSNWIHVE